MCVFISSVPLPEASVDTFIWYFKWNGYHRKLSSIVLPSLQQTEYKLRIQTNTPIWDIYVMCLWYSAWSHLHLEPLFPCKGEQFW